MSSQSVYCRLCAELKPSDKQLDLSSDSLGLQETIEKLNRLRVEQLVDLNAKNSLPKTICFTCYDLLDRSSDFLNNLERAQSVLKELFIFNVKQEKSEDEDCNDYQDEYEPDEEDDKKPLALELKQEDCDQNNDDGDLKKRRKHKKKKRFEKTLATLKNEQDIKHDATETWKDYTWKCRICDATAIEPDQLRRHSYENHNTCFTFKCIDCRKHPLTFDAFLSHVKKHRKHLKYCCHVCDQKFESTYLLKVHTHEHDSSNQCGMCGRCFEDEQSLIEHRPKFKTKSKKRKKHNEPLKKEDLTCNQCEKTFKSRANLLVHQLIHTERRRDHTCEKCGKTFFNKGTLHSHMLLHDDTRPHKCEICGALFKTTTQLRSHVGIHGGPRPYSCEQCGRSFRLRCHLKSHLIIHTDSMPHTCEFCGKAFRFKTILTQHLRQHTGVKPYVCQHCQRDFTNWPNYNKHMKRRHGIDTAKKKHTPEGVFPVNPLTGELQCLPTHLPDAVEWKNKIMNNLRKPGRPKIANVQPDELAPLETIAKMNLPIDMPVMPIVLPTFPKEETPDVQM